MGKILKLLCLATLFLTISCDKNSTEYGALHFDIYYVGNNPSSSAGVSLYDIENRDEIIRIVSQMHDAALKEDFDTYYNVWEKLSDYDARGSLSTSVDMTFPQREAEKEYIAIAAREVNYCYYDINTNTEAYRTNLTRLQYKTVKVEAGTTVNTTFVFQDYSSNIRL